MRVSFDFDGTISEPYIQFLADSLIKAGVDVYIITARVNYPGVMQHEDLYQIANELGLVDGKIHFTNGALKLRKIEELKINIHFDDMEDEIDNINRSSKLCKGVLVDYISHNWSTE